MIRPNVVKWGQTVGDLRRLATEANHPRTRERFQALYMIASGQSNATRWAREIDRNDETILAWVHLYNESGPDYLIYCNTGGCAPFLLRPTSRKSSPQLKPRPRKTTTSRVKVGR